MVALQSSHALVVASGVGIVPEEPPPPELVELPPQLASRTTVTVKVNNLRIDLLRTIDPELYHESARKSIHLELCPRSVRK
ncbi:MAG: hypothetical protein ACREN8_11675, partial [Candidatus Dormibacteraceae bacterium]